MITNEQIALGKSAVKAKRFRWLVGMNIIEPEYGNTSFRLCWKDDTYYHGVTENSAWYRVKHANMMNKALDITDYATLGCLLALVREALNRQQLTVEFVWTDPGVTGLWRVWYEASVLSHSDTEAGALISALSALDAAYEDEVGRENKLC